MNRKGTAQYRFRAGFTRIPDFHALKISGGDQTHEAETFRMANSPTPFKVQGQIEYTDVSIELAIGADQNAINELNRWFNGFTGGVDLMRRTGWAEDLDESGRTPLMAREFVDCLPAKREHGERSADGKGIATVTFTFSVQRVNYY